LRARQVAETRQMVITAAARLFGERGWSGTTLAAVAAEAGTAIETIYSGFGSKVGVLVCAIDVAIAGDDDDRPIEDRPQFALLGTGPQIDRLQAAAQMITAALLRAVPLMKALREASASEEAARARFDTYEADRRITIGAGLRLVLGETPPEAVVDSIWALASPEVFIKLTKERDWSVENYQTWLVETASAILGDR
jgi:AcrR family transcriptional regulator